MSHQTLSYSFCFYVDHVPLFTLHKTLRLHLFLKAVTISCRSHAPSRSHASLELLEMEIASLQTNAKVDQAKLAAVEDQVHKWLAASSSQQENFQNSSVWTENVSRAEEH